MPTRRSPLQVGADVVPVVGREDFYDITLAHGDVGSLAKVGRSLACASGQGMYSDPCTPDMLQRWSHHMTVGTVFGTASRAAYTVLPEKKRSSG